MSTNRQYDSKFKAQAVSLARKIGNKATAAELGIPQGASRNLSEKTSA